MSWRIVVKDGPPFPPFFFFLFFFFSSSCFFIIIVIVRDQCQQTLLHVCVCHVNVYTALRSLWPGVHLPPSHMARNNKEGCDGMGVFVFGLRKKLVFILFLLSSHNLVFFYTTFARASIRSVPIP
ncbi:hypothetical protein LZ32DRAFT_437480 [Colletotrichum eremochloae]|nr:hypothetical protein LZ32DRAFT_437480 [Colletotrichum eremochloae]